jgi:glycosyltransferase involved in cell wall biosynthesis
VIANGADLAAFRPDPAERSPEPSLLFVGALGGRKRGARLVEWFADTIGPAFPTCTLTMLSEPGAAVPGVSYRSGLDGTALAKLYRSAWVYCSPSTYEGFGLPYLEAMASGTPVVATPNPGSREVLADGAAGLLVPDDAFPGAVVRLLGDAAERARLAALGLARAQAFTLDRMIDAYESLLLDMTRRP